jgi:hypothetical protein
MASYLKKVLTHNPTKPFKIDVRDPCHHNLEGCVTRTFEIRRRDLLDILQDTRDDVMDRIDITELPEEDRMALHNASAIDRDEVAPIRRRSIHTVEWDREPQYGEMSERLFRS